MLKLKDLQGPVVRLTTPIAAAATAATSETVVGRVPFRSAVVGAYWIPSSAMTGAGSNNRKLSVVNKGSAGAGTAVPAEVTYTASVDAAAFDASALTVSATESATYLAEGDVVSLQALVNGTGLPLPAGQIIVELQAR